MQAVNTLKSTIGVENTNWSGACVYNVSEIEQRQLIQLAQEVANLKMHQLNRLDLWCEIKNLSDKLPQTLRAFLTNFSVFSNPDGFIILRGLPVENNLPLTPQTDSAFANYSLGTFAKINCLISSRLGFPRGYEEEKEKLILQPIYPKPNDEFKQENSSSLGFLEEHTEDGFLPEFCNFLMLGCLRSDHKKVARTGVACSWKALKLIPWNLIQVLNQPRFIVEPPSSFGQREKGSQHLIPVLSGDLRYPRMIFDADAMRGTDLVAQEALQYLATALRQVHVSGVMEKGDLLIVDNITSVHTRSSFSARFDGTDRWLLRLKVFSNLRASATEKVFNSLTCGSISFAL